MPTSGPGTRARYRARPGPLTAITLFETVLADRERVLGRRHLGTLISYGNLASACQAAGRLDEAIHLYERTRIDSERILGPNHPSTGVVRETSWPRGSSEPLNNQYQMQPPRLYGCQIRVGPNLIRATVIPCPSVLEVQALC